MKLIRIDYTINDKISDSYIKGSYFYLTENTDINYLKGILERSIKKIGKSNGLFFTAVFDIVINDVVKYEAAVLCVPKTLRTEITEIINET